MKIIGKIKNLKIKTKLLIGFSCLCFFLLMVSFYSIYFAKKINNESRYIEFYEYNGTVFSTELKISLFRLKELFTILGLNNNIKNIEEIDIQAEKFHILISEFEELTQQIKELKSEHKNTLLKELNEINILFNNYSDLGKKITEIYLKKDFVDERIIKKEGFEKAEKLIYMKINEFQEEFESNLSLALGRIDIFSRRTQKINIIMLILSFILTIIISYSLIKEIDFSMNKLIKRTEKIAKGDFGYQIDFINDNEFAEVERFFNKMSELLKNTYQELEDSRKNLAQKVKERTAELEKTTISKNYFDSIVKYLPDALFITDYYGTITTVNQATLDLLGYKEEEVVGMTVSSYFTDNSIFEGENWEILLRENTIKNYEMDFRAINNINIPINISASIFKEKDGNLAGFVIVIRDISDLKQLQARLLESEKMASIGQLAAGMAHEINNPMCVILGFAQSLIKQINNNNSFFIPLKSIEREAIRCKDIINDLLTFSRNTISEIELIETDIVDVIEMALLYIKRRIENLNIEILKYFEINLPRIRINNNQIYQVIINLCNNAIDAMPQGGKLIINTRLIKDDNFIEVSISDTGKGISKEIEKRIYDPFFTTKDIGKGIGLGLSLCYEIIKKHNGIIEFKSEPGKETIFSFKLPVKNM